MKYCISLYAFCAIISTHAMKEAAVTPLHSTTSSSQVRTDKNYEDDEPFRCYRPCKEVKKSLTAADAAALYEIDALDARKEEFNLHEWIKAFSSSSLSERALALLIIQTIKEKEAAIAEPLVLTKAKQIKYAWLKECVQKEETVRRNTSFVITTEPDRLSHAAPVALTAALHPLSLSDPAPSTEPVKVESAGKESATSIPASPEEKAAPEIAKLELVETPEMIAAEQKKADEILVWFKAAQEEKMKNLLKEYNEKKQLVRERASRYEMVLSGAKWIRELYLRERFNYFIDYSLNSIRFDLMSSFNSTLIYLNNIRNLPIKNKLKEDIDECLAHNKRNILDLQVENLNFYFDTHERIFPSILQKRHKQTSIFKRIAFLLPNQIPSAEHYEIAMKAIRDDLHEVQGFLHSNLLSEYPLFKSYFKNPEHPLYKKLIEAKKSANAFIKRYEYSIARFASDVKKGPLFPGAEILKKDIVNTYNSFHTTYPAFFDAPSETFEE